MLRYAIFRFIFSFLHFLFPTPVYALHQSKVLALIDVKNRLGYFSGDIKSLKAKQCWVFWSILINQLKGGEGGWKTPVIVSQHIIILRAVPFDLPEKKEEGFAH